MKRVYHYHLNTIKSKTVFVNQLHVQSWLQKQLPLF